jgi:hypothetical protein
MLNCLNMINDQIDLSTDPGLKLHQITFPCAQSETASNVTMV